MARRVSSHKIETNGTDNFRIIVNSNEALFRTLSDRDYGIDGLVEFFDENDETTGIICMVQLKSTSRNIVVNKKTPDVSISVNTTVASYCKQSVFPFILIYNSLKQKEEYYYILLNRIHFNKNQTTETIRIPLSNCVKGSVLPLLEICKEFYNSRSLKI